MGVVFMGFFCCVCIGYWLEFCDRFDCDDFASVGL